jgi:pSer/pThr/pTyr-binding forkhead associated (FHA) protein
MLNDASVSHHHAAVRRRNGRWFVFDLGSLNGTFVNGEPVEREGHLLEIGDVITVGHAHLHVSAGPLIHEPGDVAQPRRPVLSAETPTYVVATLPDGERVVRPLEDAVLTIGRDAGCGLPLEDPSVSHRHATMRPANGWWFLFDAGSRNGTFVNDQPVGPNGYALLADDEARIGRVRLRLGYGAVPRPSHATIPGPGESAPSWF